MGGVMHILSKMRKALSTPAMIFGCTGYICMIISDVFPLWKRCIRTFAITIKSVVWIYDDCVDTSFQYINIFVVDILLDYTLHYIFTTNMIK